jgi:hypothetical protein
MYGDEDEINMEWDENGNRVPTIAPEDQRCKLDLYIKISDDEEETNQNENN